jgi:hypothetical protein|tara:strand:+ start:2086 stop:2547 length:462 start_codon:yes stop_codon:yes gene_type:complete
MDNISETILPKLMVKKSGIHGMGVFADEPIKEDQKIIEYKGKKISSKEGDRRSEMDEKLTYIFILNDEYDIDGNVNSNEARLINHSCDPNTYIDIIDDHIWVIAERDIAEGEELSYDYCFDADELEECRCLSKNCRGFINDPDDEKLKDKHQK